MFHKVGQKIDQLTKKKAYPYAMAFFIPFVICVIICIGNGVYPFGHNCILHIDMYHQYCPFFTSDPCEDCGERAEFLLVSEVPFWNGWQGRQDA